MEHDADLPDPPADNADENQNQQTEEDDAEQHDGEVSEHESDYDGMISRRYLFLVL